MISQLWSLGCPRDSYVQCMYIQKSIIDVLYFDHDLQIRKRSYTESEKSRDVTEVDLVFN